MIDAGRGFSSYSQTF